MTSMHQTSAARLAPRPAHPTPTVGQWMTREVATIGPDAPLLEALLLMLSQRQSFLPVIDAARRPVGLLTHVELMQALARLELRGLERARVLDAQIATFPTAFDAEPVSGVARRMLEERSGCVLVVDRAGALAGVLDEGDFLRAAVEGRGL